MMAGDPNEERSRDRRDGHRRHLLYADVIANQLISGLNSDEAQQATLEEQLSTGDMINQPSDNPAGAAELLQLNGSLAREPAVRLQRRRRIGLAVARQLDA